MGISKKITTNINPNNMQTRATMTTSGTTLTEINGNKEPGLIIYNIPISYKKEEVQEILFASDDKEGNIIKSIKVNKARGRKHKEKFLKVEVIFINWDVYKDMFNKLNNLEFDKDHVLKVKKLQDVKKTKDVSRSKDKSFKTEKKQRGVIGANVAINMKHENVTHISNSDGSISMTKEEKYPRRMGKKGTFSNRNKNEYAKDTIFVKNLDFNFTDTKAMAEFFHVNIENVSIPLRKCFDLYTEHYFTLKHLNRGFALVKFDNCLNIEGKVTEYDKCMFQGRPLNVRVAYKRLAKMRE